MSDKPSPEGAQPFPRTRAVERSAAFALAIGTLSLTATFGLRTAVFLPDYTLDDGEIAALGIHGAAELVLALLIGFVAVWLRSERVAKAALVVAAILAGLAKSFVLLMYVAITEPPDALISPGTLLLCAWASLPLWLSFLPVVSAAHAARRARALDAALGVRAAVGAWLAAVGLVTLVLGPDILVRVWSLITLSAAAVAFGAGSAEERRLHAWVRGAITQGAPVYDVQEGAVPDDVPSVYEGDARVAVISMARQDSASYRRDPARTPVAAVDPNRAVLPRSFRPRATRRTAVSLLVAALAVLLSWPFLHPDDLPPKKLAWQYNHHKISHDEDFEIPGVSLWIVQLGDGSRLVGFDPGRGDVVEGKELFRRARDMPVDRLAKLANSIFFMGHCCTITAEDRLFPVNPDGPPPKTPFVENGKLVFWRRTNGQVDRFEVDVEPEMLAGAGGVVPPR